MSFQKPYHLPYVLSTLTLGAPNGIEETFVFLSFFDIGMALTAAIILYGI